MCYRAGAMGTGDAARDLEALDRTHVWRLRCRDCGHVWPGRSAEAAPCPACESWAVVSARVSRVDGEADA